jgi:hypothetical protein
MNEDRQLEETLDRLAGPVDRSGLWASIEARAGVRKQPSAPRRRSGLRIAVFASIAIVLVTAVAIGSVVAVRHLGQQHFVLRITDDTDVGNGGVSDTASAMFRGNLERTGVYPSGGPTHLNGLAWKFKAGGGVWSSPAFSDGVVYVGSDDDYLHAVDAKTGQEEWKFKTYGGVRSSPAISDGVAYIGCVNNYLFAVDIQSGQEKWKFRTGGEVRSSPAIAGGVVYFGSVDTHLYAVDIQSGQEKWKFQIGGSGWDGGAAGISSPAISDGVVYVGSGLNHCLYAVDINTGRENWKFQTGAALTSSPAISDGLVYFGSMDGYLYAVR